MARKLRRVPAGLLGLLAGSAPNEARLPSYIDWLIRERLVSFIAARELKRVRDVRFALGNTRNDVRAADPMRFLEIGLRPLRRMIGMGMIEADDVLVSLARLALDANELLGIDVIAVLGRIGAGVAAAGGRRDRANVAIHLSQKHAAAFMRISFLAVAADFRVILGADLQHAGIQALGSSSRFKLIARSS